MKDEDLVILTPAIVAIQNLEVLVLAKNVITSKSMNYLLDRYISNAPINGLKLKELNVSRCLLEDGGVSDIFDRTHMLINL
jgi:Ran GTPase-activating protein (RanGAP) involved in mRNA processing and transport